MEFSKNTAKEEVSHEMLVLYLQEQMRKASQPDAEPEKRSKPIAEVNNASTGPEQEDKEKEQKPEGKYISTHPTDYLRILPDCKSQMPSLPIQRVPSHILGYGCLGRCYTGTNLIQIRDDLYGNDFDEVYVHEILHAINPMLDELDVRRQTRHMFDYTRYN